MQIVTLFYWLMAFWSFPISVQKGVIPAESTIACACNRQADSLILVEFYNAAGGLNWSNTWQLNTPVSQWFGVSLNAIGCVQSINLPNNNLEGEIPFNMGNLSGLRLLHLFGNKLTGNLPPSLGNLSSLEDLALEDNLFNGEISTELGNLGSLRFLALAKNNFKGSIPSSLGNLLNLILLNLSFNELSGTIPVSLRFLTKLSILDLHQNKLEGVVPSALGQLVNLTELYLNQNVLTGELPASFSNMTKLNHAWFSDNLFVGLVPDLRAAPLNSLRLENNGFDQIPDYSTVTSWGNQLPFGFIIYGNKFTFDDLIPLSKIHKRYYYSFKPQDPIELDSVIFVPSGNTYVINTGVDPGLSDNNFKWFKDTSIVYISNRNTYELIQVSESDEGYYSGRITNPIINDFELEIAPFRVVVYNPALCDKPLAAGSCKDAPEFCSTLGLNSYCGSLTLKDTNAQVFLCDSFGFTTNARWLSFIAPSDTIEFEIFPMNCLGIELNGEEFIGMQASIWASCGGDPANIVSCTPTCHEAHFKIGGTNFKIGEKYSLVLNGCMGDLCDYLIKLRIGKKNFELEEPGVISGDQSFCPDNQDHIFSIKRIIGASGYLWFINDTLFQTTTDSFINIQSLKPAIYQLKVKAISICDTTNSSFLVFQITPALTLSDELIHKIKIDSAYSVSFKVNGGVPPYSVTKGRGKIDSATSSFVSDTFLCRSGYDFEITDSRGCTASFSGTENCGCNSQAGAMPTDSIHICEGQNFTVKFSGPEIQDPGDVGVYILFSNPINPKASILKTSTNGLFPFDPAKFKFEIQYYVSRVVGRALPNRDVNYNHPCLSFSNYQPVKFHARPLVSAGPDLSFCGFEGSISSFGNYATGVWKKVSGPGRVSFENPLSDQTKISVDSFGVFVISREVSNGYCINKDEIKISFTETLKPVIDGFYFVCSGQTTRLDGGPYAKFNWSTGDTSKILNISSSGTYCLTVTDNSGCTGSTCIAVSNSTAPSPVLIGPDTVCTGDLKFIQLSQTFLAYKWNTNDSTSILPIDTGGTYCVTVTGSNGCLGTDCIFVGSKSRSYSVRFDTVCFGETFSLNGQFFDQPGVHDVIIDGGAGNLCDSVVRVHLSWRPQIIVKDTTIIKDDGTNSGAISIVINGGSPPYNYLWSTGSKSSIITNLRTGSYSVVVTDSRNCKASFVFNVPRLTAIDQYTIKKKLVTVFPNPMRVNQQLIVRNESSSGNLFINIYSLDGSLYYKTEWLTRKNQDLLQLDVSMPAGVYFVKVFNSENSSEVQRLVIQN
ncbi:MAG: T9SS type A sorting domain-containing protein [Saprospiraceae bacterium]|nr:T9SS type A sorting domain-containing protein [Saprospiraceae bacterium]